PTHHQAMLYRRAVVGSVRYDTSLKIAADYKFTLQFLAAARNVHYCPFPLCRFEPGGVSQIRARLGRQEQYAGRRELEACAPAPNMLSTTAQFLSLRLRRSMPGLYWRLRSCGNKESAA